jgi:hypothetical protein
MTSNKAEFLPVQAQPASGGDSVSIWCYFQKGVGGSKGNARCVKCSRVLKCTGGSTKGLHDHLRLRHDLSVRAHETTASPTEGPAAKKACTSTQQTLTSCMMAVKDTLDCRYARMSAYDRISFNSLATSKDIRDGLVAMGHKPLTSGNGVKASVQRFYATAHERCVSDLKKKVGGNEFVALSFDEWTSVAQRRYVGTIVHSPTGFSQGRILWNIGLKRITGAMPATRCIELLDEHLKEFGIDLHRHVASMTTDGASVMAKVGRLLDDDVPIHQLCLAHGIHLAVMDTFYCSASSTHEDISSDDDESQDECSVGAGSTQMTFNPATLPALGALVVDVRKIVRKFRKSPLLTSSLDKYAKQDSTLQKSLKLCLDVRTRWNSLLAMLKRFLELEKCVQKTLMDFSRSSEWSFSDHDIASLKRVVMLLEPVEVAMKALCREDANLIEADAALRFMFKKLQVQTSAPSIDTQSIGKAFIANLASRITQRRTKFSSVAQYLANASYDYEIEKLLCSLNRSASPFVQPSAAETRSVITDIAMKVKNLQASDAVASQNRVSDETCSSSEPVCELSDSDDVDDVGAQSPCTIPQEPSLEEELESELLAVKHVSSSLGIEQPAPTAIGGIVRKEIALFEVSGNRSAILQQVFQAILTTRPTSVDVERAFSACAKICTTEKSRMDDNTLSMLAFLRAHFQLLARR